MSQLWALLFLVVLSGMQIVDEQLLPAHGTSAPTSPRTKSSQVAAQAERPGVSSDGPDLEHASNFSAQAGMLHSKVYHSLTRFKQRQLCHNLAPLTYIGAQVPRQHFSQYWSRVKRQSLTEEFLMQMLFACTLVLPGDTRVGRVAIATAEIVRLLHMLLNKRYAMCDFVFQSHILSAAALQAIEAHLFRFTAPLRLDERIDPRAVCELAYPTLQLVYELAHEMISSRHKTTYDLIEQYKTLPKKLVQVLDFPDDRERSDAVACLIRLFAHHPKYQLEIATRIRGRFEYLEAFQNELSFMYGDALQLFVGCYLNLGAGVLEAKDLLVLMFVDIFKKHIVPLVAVTNLAEFSAQWVFIVNELLPAADGFLPIFVQHAFRIAPGDNFWRDEAVINSVAAIWAELDPSSLIWCKFIHWMLDAASSQLLRPILHSHMIDALFGSTSILYRNFSVAAGQAKESADDLRLIYYEINMGLRKLHNRLAEQGDRIPTAVNSAIHLWIDSHKALRVMLVRASKSLKYQSMIYAIVDDTFQQNRA